MKKADINQMVSVVNAQTSALAAEVRHWRAKAEETERKLEAAERKLAAQAPTFPVHFVGGPLHGQVKRLSEDGAPIVWRIPVGPQHYSSASFITGRYELRRWADPSGAIHRIYSYEGAE